MAESLLLPVVRGVVGKAADALVQKVTRMWGVDGDRRDLELKLLEVPKLPSSLGELRINGCASLVALPSNLGDLAKLRPLSMWRCDELKALPDGMDGLTSLERLMIGYCPGIDKFPQGFLQRLPALKSLVIKDCPDLQRRCREGGEYFDLVSPIPDKDIPAATEPQKKWRFLPLCGGDSQSN